MLIDPYFTISQLPASRSQLPISLHLTSLSSSVVMSFALYRCSLFSASTVIFCYSKFFLDGMRNNNATTVSCVHTNLISFLFFFFSLPVLLNGRSVIRAKIELFNRLIKTALTILFLT